MRPAHLDSARDVILEHCGSAVVERLWVISHLSLVEAFTLQDGRRIVAKTREFEPRHVACSAVHRHVWRTGYPCSEPLGELIVTHGRSVSFETLVDDGTALDSGPPDSASSAAALARLTILGTTSGIEPDRLHPPVPWLWWDHARPGIWPLPDDSAVDLNHVVGPGFVDDAARRIRRRLRQYSPASTDVIGHGDWEAQNVFWRSGALHAVHDWDSLVGRPEPFVVGPAAAVHAVRGRPPGRPRPHHMVEFLDSYVGARGLSWTGDDRQAALTSGLWVHFFNAKKAAAAGHDVSRDHYLLDLYALLETTGA